MSAAYAYRRVMTGVVIMLGVAGALEGIGRQVLTDTGLRYAIAIFALLFWLLYLYLPRTEESDEHG